MFGGLRPDLFVVTSSSVTLTEIDHTIVVSAACNINMPSNPVFGQEYVILTTGANSSNPVVVYGNGNQFYLFNTGQIHDTAFAISDLGNGRHKTTLVFDGTRWLAMIDIY
jgi:hypothetical protein